MFNSRKYSGISNLKFAIKIIAIVSIITPAIAYSQLETHMEICKSKTDL